MTWEAREGQGKRLNLGEVTDAQKVSEYDAVKAQLLPDLVKEAESGLKPVLSVRFQPVKGVDTFEGEFGMKDGKIIFHVWPFGYHAAQRSNKVEPPFKKDFEAAFRSALHENFRPAQVEMAHDPDMGAWFAKVSGYGENQYWWEKSVKTFEHLHKLCGGESGPRQS